MAGRADARGFRLWSTARMTVEVKADAAAVMWWQRGAVALGLLGGVVATVWLTTRTPSVAWAVGAAAPYLLANAVPLPLRTPRAFRTACIVGGVLTGVIAFPLFFVSGFAFLHCPVILLLVATTRTSTTLSLFRGTLAWIIGLTTVIGWMPAVYNDWPRAEPHQYIVFFDRNPELGSPRRVFRIDGVHGFASVDRGRGYGIHMVVQLRPSLSPSEQRRAITQLGRLPHATRVILCEDPGIC